MKHRIKVETPNEKTTFRELHGVHRNEHGDIILTLDGGEAIQFTVTHAGGDGIRFTPPDSSPPAIESIEHFAEDNTDTAAIKIAGGFIFGFARWIAPTTKRAAIEGFTMVSAEHGHRYTPPREMPLSGSVDHVLRGTTKHYKADNGKPFVLLEWDTATHKHKAGLYPRKGDEGLTLDQLEAVPTWGRLCFAGGREYTRNPGGIVEMPAGVSFEELPPIERAANLAEIQAYGLHLRGAVPAKQTAPTAAKQAPKAVQGEPGELERLRAFAQLGKADAIRAFCSQFDTLPESVIVAGWLKAKGKTWSEIQKKTNCSKSTLHGRLEKFYRATGWPKADRRKGIGKTYQLDENRDAGSTETEL